MPGALERTHLIQGLLVLVVRHRPVMPFELSLHVRDTLPENGACDDGHGHAAVAGYESAGESIEVVPIDGPGFPTECFPSAIERVEIQDLASTPERLLTVHVDDGDQVIEAMMGGEHHRLP